MLGKWVWMAGEGGARVRGEEGPRPRWAAGLGGEEGTDGNTARASGVMWAHGSTFVPSRALLCPAAIFAPARRCRMLTAALKLCDQAGLLDPGPEPYTAPPAGPGPATPASAGMGAGVGSGGGAPASSGARKRRRSPSPSPSDEDGGGGEGGWPGFGADAYAGGDLLSGSGGFGGGLLAGHASAGAAEEEEGACGHGAAMRAALVAVYRESLRDVLAACRWVPDATGSGAGAAP